MVRCGAALPALLLTAFALGRWRRPRPGAATVIGLAALFGSAVLQAMFDPNLEPSFVILFTPVLVAFYVAGRVVRSRGSLVDRLESQTVELAEQRERTEQLAIDAERARIAAGLDDYLTGQIAQIASSAEAGRRALDGDGARPDAVQQAFAAIETRGRQTLAHMREVVGTLLSTSGPNEPQPTLAQLDDLIARDGRHVQVRIEGDRRRLSSGVEVAAYRIVERILEACAPPPAAPLDVLVRYGADALVLVAEGSDVGLADGPLALATIRARAASHGGSVVVEEAPDRWRLVVRLPVPADA
jgi:signal transduction histidine kinase